MAATPTPLDLKNVQGDILLGGLPKKNETCIFFKIKEGRVTEFRKALTHLLPLITTGAQVSQDRDDITEAKQNAKQNPNPPLLKLSGVNIAFSHAGLVAMGISDDIGDPVFNAGMLADAQNLGDNVDLNWDSAFKKQLHGVILVTGDLHSTVSGKVKEIEGILLAGDQAVIDNVRHLSGHVRPGAEKGHEHFGFLDGVSQPAVKGVDKTNFPGQEFIDQGIILLGRESDANIATRPSWALDGSFLCFRYLPQLVPEFDEFLKHNPLAVPPGTDGSELLGARLVGRWKSGAPIDLTPDKDIPSLGTDPQQNDNFQYDFPGDQQDQTRCPFAAHTRKTNPRKDIADNADGTPSAFRLSRRIIRSGIQFGNEVTAEEKASGKTTHERGLLFISYQSIIANGFQFIQKSWANNITFPFNKKDKDGNTINAGFDPIIGQGNPRSMLGTDPTVQAKSLNLPQEWVTSKGGEYLFTPSIPTLKGKFALA